MEGLGNEHFESNKTAGRDTGQGAAGEFRAIDAGRNYEEGCTPNRDVGMFCDSTETSWALPVYDTVAGDLHVTGTLMWYYYVCKRQVWLMAHQINPDEDDPNIAYGRFLQRMSYGREKKETAVGNCRFDLVQRRDGTIVVSEVKKTSRHEKSATMQLLFYLKELRERGIEATGELRFPEEKRRKAVILTGEALREVNEAELGIIELVKCDLPPTPVKIKLCRNCAYAEFCWC